MRRRSGIGLALGLAVVLGLTSSTSPPFPKGFLSSYHWQRDELYFGGFSGLEVSPNGSRLYAVTDRGTFATGALIRDERGLITGVSFEPMGHLLSENGDELPENWDDAEGLTLLADGTFYVSFERHARVMQYAEPGGVPKSLPTDPAFAALPFNASLEALAVDQNGTLYTMPEESGALTAPFPIYRFQNGAWDQPFSLPRRGRFLASGADIGPDGRFYVLERQFRGLAGFASRVRRFDIGPDGLSNEETLLQSSAGQHDNLESLSVWRDEKGALRLTMMSDDNRFFLQRTEIVEYRVPD